MTKLGSLFWCDSFVKPIYSQYNTATFTWCHINVSVAITGYLSNPFMYIPLVSFVYLNSPMYILDWFIPLRADSSPPLWTFGLLCNPNQIISYFFSPPQSSVSSLYLDPYTFTSHTNGCSFLTSDHLQSHLPAVLSPTLSLLWYRLSQCLSKTIRGPDPILPLLRQLHRHQGFCISLVPGQLACCRWLPWILLTAYMVITHSPLPQNNGN